MTTSPDLKTINARMESDMNHFIPGAELRPRFSVLGVLNKVYAAAVHALYQFAENLLRNILPSTCHDDWLSAWAYVLRTPRKDDESLGDWRNRIVIAFANRAKIGDDDDYTEWAIAAHADIKQAWVYGNTPALGDITIILLTDGTDPRPTQSVIDEARQTLDRLCNVGCRLVLFAPVLVPTTIMLARVAESARESIIAALQSHINTLRAGENTLYVADLHEAIRTVHRDAYTLVSPVEDITVTDLQLITLGDVLWT